MGCMGAEEPAEFGITHLVPGGCQELAGSVRIRPPTEHGQYRRRHSERCTWRPQHRQLVDLGPLELVRLVLDPGPGLARMLCCARRALSPGPAVAPADRPPQRDGNGADARAEAQPGAPGSAT